MPWAVAAAAVVAGGSIYAASEAGKASQGAAETQAQAQQNALNYQMAREELPIQFRDQALSNLGGIAGYEGGTGSQQELIDRAKASPLYQQIIGNQQLGEDAITRNAAATGGLRSGDVQANLYDYNTRLENEALLESYNQQLGGIQQLAGMPLNTNAIANQMSNIGGTRAAGDIAAANAQQVGWQNAASAIGQGIQNYGMANYSDIRLKTDIKHEGTKNNHEWYSWEWNELANELGLNGRSEGVMAHLVYNYQPDSIVNIDGFIGVDMDSLGIDQTTELLRC